MLSKVMNIFSMKIIVLLSHLALIGALEPCIDFAELNLPSKRDPEFGMDSNPLCDRSLIPGWYKVRDSIMTTSPPALGKCGTTYPIWLSGKAPTDVYTTVTLTACQVGIYSSCERSYDIEVRRCPYNDLVYNLLATTTCNSAYCFENIYTCVDKKVSNVEVEFHNVTWKSLRNFYLPIWNFVCSFVPISQISLLYTVEWYADNEWIANYTVDGYDIYEKTLTSEDLLNLNKTIGVQLQCAVGAKKDIESTSCFHVTSDQFPVGFEILNTTLTLGLNGKESILIKQNIPYADISLPSENHTASLYIDPSYTNDLKTYCKDVGNPKRCDIEIIGIGYNFQSTFKNVVHELEIQSLDPLDYYIQKQRLVLRLGTKSNQPFFSGVTLPDINVDIVENSNSWKGKRCSSYADPHMKTFDGISYECQKGGCVSGTTYMLYENKQHLQQVQVRHGSCWGIPRCVCAVAARSGRDVFVLDFCSGREFINFPMCEDKSLQVYKDGDFKYRVIFPTGTSLKVYMYNYKYWRTTSTLMSWYINVEVYPTISDENATSGLCGYLDDIPKNDLRWKNGFQDDPSQYNYYKHPDNFSKSWRLPSGSSEDLLQHDASIYDNLQGMTNYSYKLCYCDEVKGPVCSYQRYQNCKTDSRGVRMSCSLQTSNRRRRDIRMLQDEKYPDYDVVLQRSKRQAFTSQEDATTLCTKAFQESAHYKDCLQNVPNFGNETFINCINDIMMTGDENLTTLHVETALDQCKEYIYYNSTLQTDKKEIVTTISMLCSKNCSNRGYCNQGNCTCDPGYGGSDCSFDMFAPPTITRISDFGLCDKTTESCDNVFIYGRYFVKNLLSSCFIRRSEFYSIGPEAAETHYQVSLQEITLFEALCTLQYQTNESWITKFDFNVTNDGKQFTDTFTVHVYQSECQVFHNQSGLITFSLQKNYCFIKGSCIKENTMKSKTSCLQCDPKTDAFDWINACTTSTMHTTENAVNTSSDNDFYVTSSKGWKTDSTDIYTSTMFLSTGAITPTTSSKVSDSSETAKPYSTSSFSTTFQLTSSNQETYPQSPSSPSVTKDSKDQTYSGTPFPTTNAAVQSSSSDTKQIPTETQQTDSAIEKTSPKLRTTLATNQQNHGKNNKTSKKLTNLELVGIGVGCLVALILVGIVSVVLQRKFTNTDTAGSLKFNTAEINIYLNQKNGQEEALETESSLISFSSPDDIYISPPTATSLRKEPVTADMENVYNLQH